MYEFLFASSQRKNNCCYNNKYLARHIMSSVNLGSLRALIQLHCRRSRSKPTKSSLPFISDRRVSPAVRNWSHSRKPSFCCSNARNRMWPAWLTVTIFSPLRYEFAAINLLKRILLRYFILYFAIKIYRWLVCIFQLWFFNDFFLQYFSWLIRLFESFFHI